MKPIFLTFALVITTAAPAAAAPGSVRDFRLPPAPTPTATPQAQGPVDVENGPPRAPRVIETGTPQPSQQPSAQPSSQPVPQPTSRPSPQPSAQQPAPREVNRQPGPASTPSTRAAAPGSQADSPTAAAARQTDIGSAQTSAVENLSTSESEVLTQPVDAAPLAPEASSTLDNYARINLSKPWIIAAFAALIVLLSGLFLAWKRRQTAAANEPQIAPYVSHKTRNEPPVSEPSQHAPAKPASVSKAPVAAPRIPVQLKAEAVMLSRSIMNVTLSYRIIIRNLGTQPLTAISVSADVVTAHGNAPVDEQIANKSSQLTKIETVSAIPSREVKVVTGEFRLPVGQVRTIPQGRAQLYVPLLRLRLEVGGKEPLIRTFVVGALPPAGHSKLQPFRLDEMAQTYRDIGLRALD